MNDEVQDSSVTSPKTITTKGVAIVGLCVVACKVPLLLVLLGFGGVGATASLMELPPIVQTIGLAVAMLSVVSVVTYFGYRAYSKGNS